MPMTAQAEIFIQDACLPDGRRGVGLLATGGRIQAVGPGLQPPAGVPVKGEKGKTETRNIPSATWPEAV